MKIDTAVRAVFETEKRKPVRSSIATFLKQHTGGSRPPTSWRCSKLDAETFLDFVSKLGLRKDKDYTVVRSSLDPHTIQLRWLKDTADRFTRALSVQPLGWLNAVYACAHSLEALPEGTLTDIAVAEDSEESAPTEVTTDPLLAELIANKTLHIAQSIKDAEFPARDTWTVVYPTFCDDVVYHEADLLQNWATWYVNTAPESPNYIPPFAPMPVVEAYVRVCLNETRPEWPDAPVFSSAELRVGDLSEQHIRELYRQVRMDEFVPQGNLFTAPLESQYYEGSSSALTGYFTRNLSDWRKQNPQNKVGAWVQFNTLIRPTVDAARFMLQPKNAARYVRDLYKVAYEQDVMMSGFTRVAVHNIFPEVPGAEELTCDPDDEDYNANLAERINSESLRSHGLYYMGGLLVASPGMCIRQGTRHDLDSDSATNLYWCKQRPELPTVGPGDSLDKFALRTDELGKEWFAIVHGNLPTDSSNANTNFKKFRDTFSDLEADPVLIDGMCSVRPGSRFYPETSSVSPKHSAFMSSICGILRLYGPSCIEVVEGYSTTVHRIWSGMTTSMSKNSEDQSAFPWVPSIPVIDQLLVDWNSPRYAENADKVTDALKRLHEHPECQFRFTEREKGSKERRNCVVMVETNVVASKFLAAVTESGKAAELSKRLRLAFAAPYVFCVCSPETVASTASTGTVVTALENCARLSRFYSMASALKSLGYQDMLKDYVEVSSDGIISYPRLEEFPVNVRVTRDKDDRLIILFSLDGEAAQFIRLLFRKDNYLPFATAAYLKSKGNRSPDSMFAMDESLSQARNYVKYLKLQIRCNGFYNGTVSATALTGGEFSAVYDPDALRGIDPDEFPPREWYDICDAVRVSAVLGAR
jgi:hypothetical protein